MAQVGRPKQKVFNSKYVPDLARKVEGPSKEEKEQKLQESLVSSEELNKIQTMSPEQITAMLKDFTRRDPYNMKGLNPRFRYRFIRRGEENLNRQTSRGWEIITGEEAERIAKASKISLKTGQVWVNDGVLAKIPIELYMAIRAQLQATNRRVIGQSTNTLRRDMGSKYSRNVEESLKVGDRGQPDQVVI
jgi:hypothetical protein